VRSAFSSSCLLFYEGRKKLCAFCALYILKGRQAPFLHTGAGNFFYFAAGQAQYPHGHCFCGFFDFLFKNIFLMMYVFCLFAAL